MNAPVSVLHLQPHNELSEMLGPLAAACRFENVPGVHVVPLQRLDKRISGCVDSFSEAINCVKLDEVTAGNAAYTRYVYLHECAHLLLCSALRKAGHDMDHHGPSFLLILMVLCHRVDCAKVIKRKIFDDIDLYDFQDCPPFLQRLPEHEWRPLLLSFGLKHYERLAASDLSAEAVGAEALRLWMQEDGLGLYQPTKDAAQLQEQLTATEEALDAAAQELQQMHQNAISRVPSSVFFGTVAALSILSAAAGAYIAYLFA